MKKTEYAPGLTVRIPQQLLMKTADSVRWLGETTSPAPYRRQGDLCNFYVEVRWRNGVTSIVALRRLAIVEGA